MTVHYIPNGFHTVTPYLIVTGAERLLDFLVSAFDAHVTDKVVKPDGSIAHAAVRIGDSMVEMGEAKEPWKPMPTALHVYVPDVDAAYQKAIRAGGTSIFEPMQMFYGERSGGVLDPAGNQWFLATHNEDVPPEEMARRAAEYNKGQEG